MSDKYGFECGCIFHYKSQPKGYNVPLLNFTYNDINEHVESCPTVWNLYSKGLTLGVFQLDSNLGRKYCIELKPENIEHIAALTAILRPGTLNNRDEKGKSLTQKYCDRKNRKEDIIIEPEALRPILESTYGIIVYQEQQMRIAQELCGFSPSESDEYIRKGIAKKKPEILTKAEKLFMEGAKKVGKLNEDEANMIFGWLKAAARYSFNKCLSPKTEVISKTTKSYKKLQDLKIGECVLIPDLNYNYNNGGKWSKVLNIFHNTAFLLQVTFDSGATIQCSIDHKFYCSNVGATPLWKILLYNYSVLGQSYTHHHVTSVIPLGLQPCMDIEIEDEHHIFIANGLLTSNSHSVSYGIRSFKEMYLKAHFPLAFYTAKLKSPRNSQTKEDDANLIYEAKQFDIETKLPDLRDCRRQFYNDGSKLYFGLTDIKGFGNAAYDKLVDMFPNFKGFKSSHPFFDFVMNAARYFNDSATYLLIESGACDFFNMSREQMLEEYKLVAELTDSEKDKLWKYYDAEAAGVFI